jgi:hypothetical protein
MASMQAFEKFSTLEGSTTAQDASMIGKSWECCKAGK